MGERKMSKKPRIKAGDVYTTREGCRLVVIEYRSFKEIRVRFDDEYGHEFVSQGGNLERGTLKNPYHKSVVGIGFVGVGRFKPSVNNKMTEEYDRWGSMLKRCYCPINLRRYPSYAGCTVDPRWHNFQAFSEWLTSQPNWQMDGYELDKDALIQGNKIYGPDYCALVPKKINIALKRSPNKYGMPQGVSKRDSDKTYLARWSGEDGKSFRIGRYETPELAFLAVKEVAESKVRSMADSMRDELDPRVYESLMRYEMQP